MFHARNAVLALLVICSYLPAQEVMRTNSLEPAYGAPWPPPALSPGMAPQYGNAKVYYADDLLDTDNWECTLPRSGISVRSWISWGNAQRAHSGTGPLGFASPLSDLQWSNTASESVELSGNAVLWNRVPVSADVGTGGISGGQFIDRAFATSGQQGLFSESRSPITSNDLLYTSADIGWRFFEGPAYTIDGLFGYQYWRERYLAEGGRVTVPPLGPAIPAGRFISEEFAWQGFRLGGQVSLVITQRFAFRSKTMFIPMTHFRVEDIHYQRADLLQDPSVIDTAKGGFGFMGDFEFTYQLAGLWYLDLGYRIWTASSGQGETLIRGVNNNSQLPFDGGSTTRQGLLIGLSCRY